MKKNQQGSVLLWAIIVIMVILISLGACLTISFSYFNRSLEKEVKQQAYFTAQSGMSAIVKALSDEKQEIIDQFIPIDDGDKVMITKIEFSDADGTINEFGQASAEIEKITEKQLKITVTGTIGGKTSILYGDVAYTMDKQSQRDKWQLVQLYDEEDRLIVIEDEE